MDINWLIVLVALFPALYLCIFLHELGHVVMGGLTGYQVTSFGLGLGRPLWVVNWKGTRVYFCLSRPTQGLTWLISHLLYPSRGQQIAMFSGGFLANGVGALAALGLWLVVPGGRDVWLVLLVWNVWIGATSLIPITVRLGNFFLRSDAAVILQLLWRGAIDSPPEDVIRTFSAMRGFWQQIGDLHMLRAYQLYAALSWTELGDGPEAERLCTDAERLEVEHTQYTRSLRGLARAIVASEQGQLDQSEQALADAEEGYRSQGDEGGLFVVAWVRAMLLARQGDAPAARVKLKALQDHPVLACHRELRPSLLESELAVAVQLADAEGVRDLLGRYEIHGRQFPSLARDLRVYRAVAGFQASRGEWAKAETAYQRAATTAGKLHQSLLLADDRERFLKHQEGLLQEAEVCLRQLDKEEDVEALRRVFPSPEEEAANLTRSQEQQNRGLHLLGFIVANFNLTVGAIVLSVQSWYGPYYSPQYQRGAILLAIALLLLLGGGAAVLCRLGFWLVGRWSLAARRSGGNLTLILALVPWLLVLLLLLVR